MPLFGEEKKKYQREWLANRRREWIKSQGGKCRQCGTSKFLQIDHVNPGTKVTHKVWSWSKERQKEELRKCQVLCRLCHKKKTFKDLNWSEHGIGAYERGCRCSVCKKVKAIKWKKYRSRVA